jgi:hypothetical protein
MTLIRHSTLGAMSCSPSGESNEIVLTNSLQNEKHG